MKGVLVALTLVSVQSVGSVQSARPRFEAVQPELLGTGGAFVNAFADYDGDGDPDHRCRGDLAVGRPAYYCDEEERRANRTTDCRADVVSAWADLLWSG